MPASGGSRSFDNRRQWTTDGSTDRLEPAHRRSAYIHRSYSSFSTSSNSPRFSSRMNTKRSSRLFTSTPGRSSERTSLSRINKMPSDQDIERSMRSIQSSITKFRRMAEERKTSVGQSAFNLAITNCISRGREAEALEMLDAIPKYDQCDAVNEIDRNGSSLVHHIGWHDKRVLCKRILAMKADPNRQNLRKNTGLHLACQRGNKAICTMLALHGADLNVRNLDGFTPLDKISDEAERARESKRLHKLQEGWKDEILDKMLASEMSGEEKSELKEIFDYVDREFDNRQHGAIGIETVAQYLRMDSPDGGKGLQVSNEEIQEFYLHLVGTDMEFLRLSRNL
ncbi:hypothetical protein AAMO2058_000174300 [Amorphochlora amoebiformis]